MRDWQPIESFNPAIHQGQYWFADESNVILGHWYEGEGEPRMAYCGQEFPIWPTHWMEIPDPPLAKDAVG